jgi:radical SAM superfamily enzyme YgiQ (UPF0313 family)
MGKFKLLLIQPKTFDTSYVKVRIMEYTRFHSYYPPLGLATIAALTPPDFDVKVLDEQIEEIDFNYSCHIVGITGYSRHVDRMIEISEEFRKRGCLVVAGGVGCNVHSDKCENHFDVLFYGECEKVWPEFLYDWKNGNHKKSYNGGFDINLSESPAPRWDLIDISKYHALTIQTSRGCPYDCEYCDVVAIFGRKLRYKPHVQVMEELKGIIALGKEEVFFVDDNFVVNVKKTKQLLHDIINLNISRKKTVRFLTQVTIDIALDEGLLDLMRDAGFKSLFIGIETPNKSSLIESNKSHNLKMDLGEAVKRIQRRGIYVLSGGIVGFDSDDTDIYMLYRKFLEENGLIAAYVGLLIARRGTKLWYRLQKEGRLISDESQDTFGTVNFYPKKMSREYLEFSHIDFLVRHVYTYKSFLIRLKVFIDELEVNQMMKTKEKLTFAKAKAGFLIISYFFLMNDIIARIFILKVLRIAMRKPKSIALVLELVFWFQSRKEQVESSQAYKVYRQKIENHMVPSPIPDEMLKDQPKICIEAGPDNSQGISISN